jgi:hypothetical protein
VCRWRSALQKRTFLNVEVSCVVKVQRNYRHHFSIYLRNFVMSLVLKFEEIVRPELLTALTVTSTLMMVASSSEISVHTYHTIRRHVTQYGYRF